MFGLQSECMLHVPEQYHTLSDYEGAQPRWCSSCGDHAVLTAVQKVCREKQLPPEKTVFVSGIGCSSRFPHYMKTYGFHGLHGRPFPVAEGIKFRRPDLDVFVATGDGDCCSIGAGHWIHAIRYNMNMTVMLLDNEIYGLTKMQTSPTSRKGTVSNTHPHGSILPPINPLITTLGVANASFVAQTVDWNPAHLYSTLLAAHSHQGFSFVRILQRCPHFSPNLFAEEISNPDLTVLLTHENGIEAVAEVQKMYKNSVVHDPADMNEAREIAQREDLIPIGLFFCDPSKEQYDKYGASNIGFSPQKKADALNVEFEKYAV